jgi:hypothetical protein
MRLAPVSTLVALHVAAPATAQAPGKFPPDSLINTRVIPKGTPPIQVIGTMRNFAGDLGVRCQFCPATHRDSASPAAPVIAA